MSGSKAALSGLRTVKRDWSTSSKTDSDTSQKSLDPRAQRIRDIQAALDGQEQTSVCSVPLQNFANVTTADIASGSKRPSSASSHEPAAKKRVLPPTWGEDVYTSSSNFTTAPRKSSTTGLGGKTTSGGSAAPGAIPSAQPAHVLLSQEQTKILRLVELGDNLFYTGSAGTGKSVLLREIIHTLRKKYVKSPDAVAITASTGIAACNIGGVTVHSFAGIGIGEGTVDDLLSKVRRNKKASTRWARTRALIIDEVSMVDGDLFDKLARIASLLRKSSDPFGGIQVVVTGDFFQLPPVAKGTAQMRFAFEAEMWNQTMKHTLNLTKVFRQKDQEFVNMLNEMRFGQLTQKSILKFKSLSREIEYGDGLGPTELFPRREDVDRSNQGRMSSLKTEEKDYIATDTGTITDPAQREKMLSNFMAPKRLALRVGAQVMLIKNMDESLVNGSMGKVLRFVNPSSYQTDYDTVDASGRSKAEKKKPSTNEMLVPVVEFLLPNKTKREILITPENWKVELPSGEVQVSRTQLPLILAWAMSIHKSQGQTLERVKVDLGRVFEKGQAYVALSRATTLDGLQVHNFDAKKVSQFSERLYDNYFATYLPLQVQAHPKVVEWSRTLQAVSE